MRTKGDADNDVVSIAGWGDCGGGSGGGKNGVVVEEVFSTDAIMRDLRKSYLTEKSALIHEM